MQLSKVQQYKWKDYRNTSDFFLIIGDFWIMGDFVIMGDFLIMGDF